MAERRKRGPLPSLYEIGKEPCSSPPPAQEIQDRKAEAKRVVARLAALVEEHRQAALPLHLELGVQDLRLVLGALRRHAHGHPGKPLPGARDEIHAHCLTRLFDELVEEPSNILFPTKTGPDTIRYEAMNIPFWLECLALLEATYCPSEK
ncbi:MAG: hypothetical protein AAF555_10880 [Verrucomicrobiota bacterium]